MRISAPAASCTRNAPSTCRFSSVKGGPRGPLVLGLPFSRIFHDCRDLPLTGAPYSSSCVSPTGGFMLTDARGCPTSAPTSVSLQQYEQALELSLSYQLDPLATIQKALDADPTFARGHCLRAALAVMATDR